MSDDNGNWKIEVGTLDGDQCAICGHNHNWPNWLGAWLTNGEHEYSLCPRCLSQGQDGAVATLRGQIAYLDEFLSRVQSTDWPEFDEFLDEWREQRRDDYDMLVDEEIGVICAGC